MSCVCLWTLETGNIDYNLLTAGLLQISTEVTEVTKHLLQTPPDVYLYKQLTKLKGTSHRYWRKRESDQTEQKELLKFEQEMGNTPPQPSGTPPSREIGRVTYAVTCTTCKTRCHCPCDCGSVSSCVVMKDGKCTHCSEKTKFNSYPNPNPSPCPMESHVRGPVTGLSPFPKP